MGIKVELNLFASLARYMPDTKGEKVLEVPEGTTIRGLLERVDVPLRSVKILFLNGVHAREEDTLKDGDRLGVFPPVAGG